jgi:hypothetical protein
MNVRERRWPSLHTTIMTDDAPLEVDPSIYAPPKAEDAPPQVEERRGRPPMFFAVSPLKLVVMSVVTLGAYELFWFYANWQRLRRRRHPRISPFWRTMFVYIHCYSLFKTVKEEADATNVRTAFSPGLMALGWIVTTLLWKLPDPGGLISMAAVVFLVPVQKAMNDVNHALAPGHDPNTRFTAWNISGIVLGGLVLGLAVWGSLP